MRSAIHIVSTAQVIVFSAIVALIPWLDKSNADPAIPASIEIRGEFVTHDRSLTNKFLVPFRIPSGYMMTGLHGTTLTSSQSSRMSETLFSLHVATSGACPSYGENMAQYKDIFSKYPQVGLGAIIAKQVNSNTQVEPVSFKLPIGVSLNNPCGYVILDGSDFAGGPYKMKVALAMSISPNTKPAGMLQYSTQDEFILGDNNHDNAFKLTHVQRDTKLFAIFGDIAATTMPHSQYRLPEGGWQVTHLILLYRGGCNMFPNQDQDSNTVRLNESMQNRPILHRVIISGLNSASYYQPINKIFASPIILHKNDCLVHAIRSNTRSHMQTGAFNTEAQIFYETSD